jgi:2-hydroxychromene-2-carboxylate isomerase
MKTLDFWFDPISPFAYLAFRRLPDVLEGQSYHVRFRPILFAALLEHWGQKGPAEIEPKRAWTFRQVHWLAHRHGWPLATPARHPFNPLRLLRLAWACAPEGLTPGRHVCDSVLRHVWEGGGADAEAPERMQALEARLAPRCDPGSDAARQALRNATTAALDSGVFGVPTIGCEGKLFWGFDGLDMLADHLRGGGWFDQGHWESEGAPRPGVAR